jgi:hypothetical protein
MRLLALRDALIRSAPADESWDTPLFLFLCTCGADEPFERVYALLLEKYLAMLQQHVAGSDGSVAIRTVALLMDAAQAALHDALRRQPESLEQLRAWLF